MSTPNPYAAPKAAVADETVVLNADFIPGGESRPAGHGWRWITAAWELFKRQPALWIGMILLAIVIFIAAALIPIAGGLLTTLFAPVFVAGVMIGCRALDEGGELELGHLFAGFRSHTGTLIGVGAAYLGITLAIMFAVGLTMGVGFLTLMGAGDPQEVAAMGVGVLLALLVMTALLMPVAMAVWFAAPLVVFQGQGVFEAMKGSFLGCLKNILSGLVYGVVLFVLSILASLPLMLGWLVLGPVIAASIYTAYRDIYFRPR